MMAALRTGWGTERAVGPSLRSEIEAQQACMSCLWAALQEWLVNNTCPELRKEAEAGDRDVESLHLRWSE